MRGVYIVACQETGHRYVGQSIQIASRWAKHRDLLRAGVHHNEAWQRAWDFYGEDAFTWEVLEEVRGYSHKRLIERERYHIAALPAEYNLMAKGEMNMWSAPRVKGVRRTTPYMTPTRYRTPIFPQPQLPPEPEPQPVKSEPRVDPDLITIDGAAWRCSVSSKVMRRVIKDWGLNVTVVGERDERVSLTELRDRIHYHAS